MVVTYIFTSARLGFRNWRRDDLTRLAAINTDTAVMAHFPKTQSAAETEAFIQRMQELYSARGYCYFAVDKLENRDFIGFIGLAEQTFESDFTPCVDIGWRIKKSEWGKDYATEGARACLNFAFSQLGLEKVMAVAPVVNLRSIAIMQKIGMEKVKEFKHPRLLEDKRLADCVLYAISKAAFNTILNFNK